jgi:hypothetical protein
VNHLAGVRLGPQPLQQLLALRGRQLVPSASQLPAQLRAERGRVQLTQQLWSGSPGRRDSVGTDRGDDGMLLRALPERAGERLWRQHKRKRQQ